MAPSPSPVAPAAPAPPTAARPERAGPPGRPTRSGSRWSSGTTPGWYRAAAVLCVLAAAGFGLVATAAGLVVRGSSATVEDSTAPSLIAVQDVLAGLAEADAAATAVHLSGTTGNEDRTRRNLYREALARAAARTEEVARTAGDDEDVHDALARVAVDLTTYSGRIESARAADGDTGARRLREALDLSQGDVATSLLVVSDRNRERFDAERDAGRLLLAVALAFGLLSLVALAWFQYGTFQRSNRWINPGLALATVLVLVALAVLGSRIGARSAALERASDGGYDAIATTSATQTAVFALQSELSLRLIGSAEDLTPDDRADVDGLTTTIDQQVAALAAGADSPREEAAAAELAIRWERYRLAADVILELADAGRDDEAVAAFQGDGLSTFNGVNTTVESVLSDNRAQFGDGVAGAADAVDRLPLFTAVLTALAVGAILVGTQRRLDDYR